MVSTYRIVAMAVAVALLSGCAPVAVPGAPATESAATTAPLTETPRYSPRQALSLDLVPGIQTLSHTDEEHRIFAQWLTLPGHPEVERAQRRAMDETIASFLGELDKEPNGTGSVRELSIEPELTGCSRAMLGIRSSIATVVGHRSSTEYRTQWFDLDAGRSLQTRELFADASAWQRFTDLVGEGLRRHPGTGEGNAPTPDPMKPASVNFDAAGDALVEFSENAVAPGTAGNVVVKVPATEINPLLGVHGQQVRDAGMHPTGLPAPKPSPSSLAPGGDASTDAPTDGPDRDSSSGVDCRKVKCVALTFDDGPGPKTGKLLDVLKQENAAATFFVVGPNAETRPKMLVRMLAEGHEIGNHTWNHRVLTSLTSGHLAKEIGNTARAVQEATGVTPTLMRPPYGAVDAKVKKAAGSPVILWNVDTLDWKVLDATKVVSNALRDTKPGSIVLMHDIHSSTIDAAPAILKGLRSKGYHFVTVSELLAPVNPKDGAVYGRGPAPGQKTSKH